MASDRGSGSDSGIVFMVAGLGALLCCGMPVYAWFAIRDGYDDVDGMRSGATTFLDAWRDDDVPGAMDRSCSRWPDDFERRLRTADLASYEITRARTVRGKTREDHYVEADLAYADGRRQEVSLTMSEGSEGWRVCAIS